MSEQSESPVEIVVRPAQPADAAGISDCLDSVARERRWLCATEGFGIRATDDFIRANLAARNPHFVAVAERTGVVGWCDIIPPRPWPGFAHLGQLGMGVLLGWRGSGIGSALLEAALAACPARGFSRIELEVYAHNTAARALYRRFGFVEEGRKVGARVIDGEIQDIVLMAFRSGDGHPRIHGSTPEIQESHPAS